MDKSEEKLKSLIDKGSNIGGSVSGASVGLVFGGPVGAISGAVAGPIITDLFKKIGIELTNRLLGNREKIRVGATFSLAMDKLDQEIKKGKKFRNKEFYESTANDRSEAETIFEGTLLKARDEYEEKKIIYYSNFLANINLDNSISFEKGNTLLRIIEQLSYRQIVILSYFEEVDKLDTEKWKISFARIKELGKYQDFYSDIMDLYNQQILQEPNSVSMGVKSLILSPLGKVLCGLLDIHNVDSQDKHIVKDTVQNINDLIE